MFIFGSGVFTPLLVLQGSDKINIVLPSSFVHMFCWQVIPQDQNSAAALYSITTEERYCWAPLALPFAGDVTRQDDTVTQLCQLKTQFWMSSGITVLCLLDTLFHRRLPIKINQMRKKELFLKNLFKLGHITSLLCRQFSWIIAKPKNNNYWIIICFSFQVYYSLANIVKIMSNLLGS